MSSSQNSFKAYPRSPDSKYNYPLTKGTTTSGSPHPTNSPRVRQIKTSQSKSSFSNAFTSLFGKSRTVPGEESLYVNKHPEFYDIPPERASVNVTRGAVEISPFLPEIESIPQLTIYPEAQPEPDTDDDNQSTIAKEDSYSASSPASENPQPRSSSLKSSKDKLKRHTKGSPSTVAITKEGYLNKKADLYQGSTMGLSRSWKVYRVILKGSKLYFYKPPSESELKSIFPLTGIEKRPLTIATTSLGPPISSTFSPSTYSPDSNDRGIPLNSVNFANSARVLIFEPIPRSNDRHLSISFPIPVDEPLYYRYCFGECFTEVDPGNFRFKRFVCLLIFHDAVMICKRKWVRNNRPSLFDAVGDAIRFASSSGSTSHPDMFDDKPGNSAKGYYTKWKHDTTLPIERIDVIEASSTSFSYSNSQSSSGSSNRSTLFSLSNSSASSLFGSSFDVSQLTSGNVQAIQLFVTGPNATQRLFVAKTDEKRITWLKKFNAVKNSYGKKAGKKSDEVPRTRTLSRVADPSFSNVDLMRPQSKLNSKKSDPVIRGRLYWSAAQHPELVLSQLYNSNTKDTDSTDPIFFKVDGGTIDSLIHELVFGNITSKKQKQNGDISTPNEDFINMFLSTYYLFTSPSHVLREIRRCVGMVVFDDQLDEQGSTVLARLVGVLQIWLEDFNEDMNDTLQKDVESLVMDTIEKHKVAGGSELVRLLSKLKNAPSKLCITNEQSSVATSAEAEDSSLLRLLPDLSSIARSGLTPTLFLKIPANDFAEQLYIFHNRHRMEITDHNLLHIRNFLPFNEYSSTLTNMRKVNPFICTLSNPHFLTKLIHTHLVTTAQSMHSSRRSAILLHWIRTGVACQQLGDMASWVSIALGVCSPAVVRLRETWKGIPDVLKIQIASEWVPRLVDYGLYGTDISDFTRLGSNANANKVMIKGQIPYFGAIKQAIERVEKAVPTALNSDNSGNSNTARNGATNSSVINFDKFRQMYLIFIRAKREWCRSRARSSPTPSKTPHLELLQSYFDGMLSNDDSTLEFDVKHVFQCSLDSEPPISSRYYEEIYKNHPNRILGYQPLQFPVTTPFSPSYLEMLATCMATQSDFGLKSSEQRDHSVHPIERGRSPTIHSGSNRPGNTIDNVKNSVPLSIDVYQARKRTQSLTSSPVMTRPISPIETIGKSGWWGFMQKQYDQQYLANANWIPDLLKKNEILLFASNKELVFKVSKNDFFELRNLSSALRVYVKGGTLDRLIDILVFGVQRFNEELVTESGHPFTIGNSSYLEIDEDEYLETFFLSYRSFCIPSALIDHLRKRYMKAKKTVADMDKKSKNSNEQENLEGVSRIKLRIVTMFEYWLKNHFHDFMDSLEVRDKACAFLDAVIKLEINGLSHYTEGDPGWRLSDKLVNFANRLKKFIVATSLKPSPLSVQPRELSITVPKIHSNTDPGYFNTPSDLHSSTSPKSPNVPHAICQNVDGKSPRELVAAINQCVSSLFSPIPLHDWVYALSDLELQTIDPLAWYPKKKASPVVDDEIIFSDIYIAIEHCRHSVASSSNTQASNTLFSTIPSSIVGLFRVHEAIKVWVISEIAALTIDYKLRISRIEKFIEMILLCRHEMSALGPGRIKTFSQLGVSGDLGGKQKLYVPSFVESAIIAGLISPESRAFTKAWNDVSQNHNCGLDTLHALINGFDSVTSGSPFSPQFQDSSVTEPLGLVPSLGWMIESILEIFYYLPDLLFTSGHLINFDKRLHVYYLISSFREWASKGQSSSSQPLDDDIDMSFLVSQSGYATKPDIRQVREFAARENSMMRYNSSGGTSGSSWSSSHQSVPVRKVFAKLIHEEQEKFKRDSRERERLEREARENQLNMQRRMNEEAKIIEKRVKEQQQRRAKTKELEMMTNLMKTVRTTDSVCESSAKTPIADTIIPHFTAIPDSMGSRNRDSEAPRTSSLPSFLSKAPTVKPSLAINLINSIISVEHSHAKRDHVFKVESEEGCQYFLQAIDRQDMMDWVQSINDAAKEAAARRITVLVEDAQKEIIEQERASNRPPSIGSSPGSSGAGADSSVFGVDLEQMMKNADGLSGYTIPILVEKCLSEVESRGLCEVGIYRLSGMMSSIERLRQEFNRNAETVDLSNDEWSDINIVSGLLKQWLRELPEPLLSFDLYDDFISAVDIGDYDERLFAIKDMVHALPMPNYVLLKRLVEHLEMITDYEDINHMYASNLAIVFGPTILRPPPGPASFATSMANLGQQQSIVKNLILQYHWIFDVEADVEQESEKAAYMETLTEEAEEYEYEEHEATAR